MRIDRYEEQVRAWPREGRHILAQHDDESIVVYQAYRPSIATFAVEHGRFGGEFSFSRMSWIKPNFLWMMYRSGWAKKEGQERVLAIRLARSFFEEVLRSVVSSTFDGSRFASREAWQTALAESDVRLQWDPDHDPTGRPLARRALQLGLRGDVLRRFATESALSIEDITPFVNEQSAQLESDPHSLLVPSESVFRPNDERAAAAVGIDSWP